MLIWLLVIAAAVILLWPSSSTPVNPFVANDPRKPSYMDAVRSLQLVRARLSSTSQLDEAQRQALDLITLALASGSDK